MSARIDRLLQLITEIMSRYEKGSPKSIRRVRAQATEVVALQSGIAPSSLADIFRRQLQPSIEGRDHFDELLVGWLELRSPELQAALQQSTTDAEDLQALARFFLP